MSQEIEYGAELSVAIVVQTPAPAGERWNVAEATPEPASAEFGGDRHCGAADAALDAGAVSDPVGFVESLVNVRVSAADVLPALSVEVTPSVGELDAPSVQVKALVVT